METSTSWSDRESRTRGSNGEEDISTHYTKALDEARRSEGRPPLLEEKGQWQRVGGWVVAVVGAGAIIAGARYFMSNRRGGSFYSSWIPWRTRARVRTKAFRVRNKAKFRLLPYRAKVRTWSFNQPKAVRDFVKRVA